MSLSENPPVVPPPAPRLAIARTVAYAGNLIRAEGYERSPWPGRPGTSLTVAICRTAGCRVLRGAYPTDHAPWCYPAHARTAGWLYLAALTELGEVRAAEALGAWERRERPRRADVLAVADSVAVHLGLDGARHLACGWWAQGDDAAERLADMRRHLLGAGPCGVTAPQERETIKS